MINLSGSNVNESVNDGDVSLNEADHYCTVLCFITALYSVSLEYCTAFRYGTELRLS